MSLGSFTHTTLDGCATAISYSIDGEGCLVRETTVTQGGAHVDKAKTDVTSLTAQSPGAPALAQLDYYAQLGVDVSAIKAAISKADLKPTKAEKAVAEAAAAQAAYAASSGGADGDY